MEEYTNNVNLSKEQVKDIFNFSLFKCLENKIEIIWYREREIEKQNNPYTRVILDYCIKWGTWFV